MNLPISSLWINNKKIFIAVIVLAAASLGWFAYGKVAKNEPIANENITEATVQEGDLKISLEGDGNAEFSTVSLAFQADGMLEEIPIKEGDYVGKDTVIARLDTEEYELNVQSAKADYETAFANLNQAKINYNQALLSAEQELNTLRQEYQPMLEAPEIFTAQEIALKKLDVEYAEKDYADAKASTSTIQQEEANVSQALVNLQKAQKTLRDAVLTSPIDGKVLSISGKVGETVTELTEVVVISQDDTLYVTSEVLELDITNIYIGQPVEVIFEALPDKEFNGTITEIDAISVEDSSGLVAYQTTMQLDEPSEVIRSGMACMVSFIIEQEEDVLIIPNKAVKRVDGAQVVEKLSPNGEVIMQEIKTGFTDGRNVKVTEGLNIGDKVIIRTQSAAN